MLSAKELKDLVEKNKSLKGQKKENEKQERSKRLEELKEFYNELQSKYGEYFKALDINGIMILNIEYSGYRLKIFFNQEDNTDIKNSIYLNFSKYDSEEEEKSKLLTILNNKQTIINYIEDYISGMAEEYQEENDYLQDKLKHYEYYVEFSDNVGYNMQSIWFKSVKECEDFIKQFNLIDTDFRIDIMYAEIDKEYGYGDIKVYKNIR